MLGLDADSVQYHIDVLERDEYITLYSSSGWARGPTGGRSRWDATYKLTPSGRQRVREGFRPELSSKTSRDNTRFVELYNLLADLFTEANTIRRIVNEAGLRESKIAFASKSIDNWHAILREADRANRMEDLKRVTLNEYPENSELQKAWKDSMS